MTEVVGMAILRHRLDSSLYRAACQLCPWATDGAGCSRAVADAAGMAHLEAVHGATYSRSLFPEDLR